MCLMPICASAAFLRDLWCGSHWATLDQKCSNLVKGRAKEVVKHDGMISSNNTMGNSLCRARQRDACSCPPIHPFSDYTFVYLC
ncbi:hypothetical protein CEXT_560061 [Caerostris extrusa]|uniref:Secreted protein n=1 Tax=Caerostris extrusa TaxID=172846 RepID=A0AAV4XRH1_CAEEX|nr:hypothetical protein CEXT_560061 [Caerostris extrusa]